MIEKLDTDYLIVGAGAMSMAFADVILRHDKNARIVMVDKRPVAGGHWNDAYPFVRLHQPAIFYGLPYADLGSGGEDLVSGPEIVTYYQQALERFIATGRLRFLSMCEYVGDGQVVSTVDPDRGYEIVAHRRIVDGSYMEAQVPAMVPPAYEVDPDVELIAPNGLTRTRKPYAEYVIAGAGKTAVDAILFLLDNGVPPDRITWITPNDSWLWDRSTVQAGLAMKTFRVILDSILTAPDTDTAYLDLERKGILTRIDTTTMPTKWRCATVERSEVAQLRLVDNVVRLGRVQKISSTRVELDGGAIDIDANSLVVDCTASGLRTRPAVPIFADNAVTLQSVLMCQQTFSAALLARVELLNMTDARRNELLKPVPHPNWADDLATVLPDSIRNMLTVTRALPLWLRGCRLYLGHFEKLGRYVSEAARMDLVLRRHGR